MKVWAIASIVLIGFAFLFVAITHKVYTLSNPPQAKLEFHPLLPEYGDLMMLSCVIGTGYLVQACLENFRVPTPYGGFVVIVGFLWGILCYYNPVAMYASNIMNYDSQDFSFVFLPVMAFQMAFNMDVPLFMKTFSQTLVIAVCVNFGSALLFGIMASYIVSISMTERVGILLGVFASPIAPQSVTNILKQQSASTKQISVLLEGEALFALMIADYTYKLTLGKVLRITLWWYQMVAVTVRILLTAIPTGFLFGYIGRYMIRKMYSNRLSVYLVCLGLPFWTYTFSEVYASGCGSISVVILGAILGLERRALPREINIFLTDFWNVAGVVLEVVLVMRSAMVASAYITTNIQWYDYPLTFVIYMSNYMMRFLCFLLFFPVFSRMGYGMNLKYLTVCTWGGLKSPLGLLTVTIFYELDLEAALAFVFFHYILWIYFFSVFINGSFTVLILDYLDLTKISLARQVNMNNCMKHIFGTREKTIAVLKTDRFLADANWPVVIKTTEMTHPYHLGMTDAQDEDFLGYRFTWCGDCKKDILQEPTRKEMMEMMREAKMRVLKARRMSYSRQFETGMMTKEGIRVLSRITELAMDSEDAEMKTDHLIKNFTQENCFKRFIRKQYEKISHQPKYRKPRTYWRRLCYKVVLKDHLLFEKIMLVFVIICTASIIVELYFHTSLLNATHSQVMYGLEAVNFLFILVFLTEMVMKILAYSWIHICYHGFRTYFKSIWNILDVLALIAAISSHILDIYENLNQNAKTSDFEKTRQIVVGLKLLRAVRILRIFQIFYPDLINFSNKELEVNLALSFEIGKCFILGEKEILDMLPYMIDNIKIRSEMKHKIEQDKMVLQQLLGVVQRDRPWIAITVKTTQAIRMILNGMNEAINQLKATGWVDAFEHEKLMGSMDELYKKVNAIKKVDPSSPKTLFREVAWMSQNQELIDFLFENVTMRMFAPGEVVFGEGEVADGIYILVTGLLVMTYKPDVQVIQYLKERGLLPVVDYLAISQFEEETVDYIISGNCLGELSTLTEQPYNCTITADVHSQVYVLSRSVLRRAMEMNSDPVTGLAAKIWKDISLRITIPLLLSVPAYQTLPQEQIKFILERAFVPNLKRYKIFAVSEIIEDIVLINGVVVDYNTRDTFVAPCYIPRTVQKLILPASSLVYVPSHDSSQIKLLIIPSQNVDEYDVMLLAEETCELIPGSSTQCLQHTIQEKGLTKKNRGLTRREMARRRGPQHGLDRPSHGTLTSESHISGSSLLFRTAKSEAGSLFMPAEEEETTNVEYHTSDGEGAPQPPPTKRRHSRFFM